MLSTTASVEVVLETRYTEGEMSDNMMYLCFECVTCGVLDIVNKDKQCKRCFDKGVEVKL